MISLNTLENELIDKAPEKVVEALFLVSPIAIELYDSNGKLIKINQTCLELFGISNFEDVKGFELFKDPNLPKKYLKRLKNGESIKYETTFSFDSVKDLKLYNTCKTGEITIDVLITPLTLYQPDSISYYLVQVQDITERKKSENKLKESEEKFRELFNNMSSGVAVYEAINNGKDFVFKEFNIAGEKIDKIKKKDLIGKSILRTFPSVKKFGLFEVFQRVYKTGTPEYHPVALYKDKRVQGWRENYVYKLSTGEIVAVYDDITERMTVVEKLKDSEENLKRLNEELERKVEERTKELKESEANYRDAYERSDFYKDLFIHDISNILQVINSSTELIKHYFMDANNVDIVQVLKMIKNQIMRGKKLIYTVHRLSELEESDYPLQKIDIIEFLKQIITLIKKTENEKEIDINIEAPHNNFLVYANALLEDLFENLIINAIKYNENPLIEILIKLSKTKKDDTSFIKIEFIDNGIGIQDERKEMIFQRGNREFKGTKGMGLGLSLVNKIVENFHGQIWVENKVKGDYSKGSNFIVMLPEAD